jgi:hypothetical protein
MKDGVPAPQFPDVKPIPYKVVHVWLADGTRILGMWTGERWWSTKGEINPVEWELEVRKKKTEKLLKALNWKAKV